MSPAITIAPSPVVGGTPRTTGPAEIIGPVGAGEGILDLSASAGEPQLGAGDSQDLPPRPADSLRGDLVDGVVGHVNNKAIYINEFLEPMGRALEAEASRRSPEDWVKFAHRVIAEELNRQVEDELLLAEARATFVTPEQRANLRAFLEIVRGNILSDNYGSRHRAEQALMREKGRDVEGELQDREKDALIRSVIGELERRANVPFREVILSYEREYDRFNPPPRAEFHLIKVSSSNTAAIDTVTKALAAGEQFSSVAAGPVNEYRSDTGGKVVRTFTGDYAREEFFSIPGLNDAAHSLTPGAHSGPIALDNYLWWLQLDRIDRTSMSLYEAQLSLESQARNRLSGEARKKLVQRLKERASFTNIDLMVNHLVRAARERYYKPARG